jgi:UDP-N-acetylglucosamine 3-dehydrogenase
MLTGAVIGAGSIGQHHARVYKSLDGVHLAGVVDPEPHAAKTVASRNNVPAFSSLEQLFAAGKIDFASVAAPTSLHFEIGMALIERGVAVMMEKPLASTVAQGERLVKAARERNVLLATGHIERFNPAVVELRKQLSMGMAGRVHKVFAQRLSPYPPRIHDVGVVVDLASHDIDLLRFLVGERIIRVYGETLSGINSDREDLFNGLLRFEGGAVGILDVNWMTPKKVRRVTVTGDCGHFECDLLSQELYFFENDAAPSQWHAHSVLRGVTEGNVLGIRIQRQEPLVAELRDFVDAVRDRRPPGVTGEDGLETLRLALEFVASGSANAGRVERPAPPAR